MTNKPPLSYRDAGVDIDAGNEFVDRIKPIVKKTMRPEVLAGLGGFGGLFEIPTDRYRKPVLVSGTDGVGTKLKLAQELGVHDTIGIDLVAMCVNDVLVVGAEPLFFLDYFATGRLDIGTAEAVVRGIADGCKESGMALIGGETAEMPGMYAPGEYDLAGFCVGVVEKELIIDGSATRSGDVLIGLASSGPHSNGYSLIRQILDRENAALDTRIDSPGKSSLGDCLLAPTRIYVRSVRALLEKVDIHSLAHITGGGLTENLPRVLPNGTQADIDIHSWKRPGIFDWLQEHGPVSDEEMLRTFNCGIGMVIAIAADDADIACSILESNGESPVMIGGISDGNQNVVFGAQ